MPPDSLTDFHLAPTATRHRPRLLVWQWGRRGSPPRLAASLADGLRATGAEVTLSLSTAAELLAAPDAPANDLPVATYTHQAGFAARFGAIPLPAPALARRLGASRPDAAICALPGPLDLWMAAALGRLNIPFAVIVHDAVSHPGDGLPLQMPLQRALCRRAAVLVSWSAHVGTALRAQGFGRNGQRLVAGCHPPLRFGVPPPPAFAHGGPPRLLFFGRFLRYKGLDLLAAAATRLGVPGCQLRVVGAGPDSPALAALRALPWTQVENRWVPETEVAALLAWADALVLPYTAASQRGVAAAALAAGRALLATKVGGLPEQLAGEALARLCAPDAEHLAAAWRGLLSDPPRGAPADAAAGWVRAGAEIQAALAP